MSLDFLISLTHLQTKENKKKGFNLFFLLLFTGQDILAGRETMFFGRRDQPQRIAIPSNMAHVFFYSRYSFYNSTGFNITYTSTGMVLVVCAFVRVWYSYLFFFFYLFLFFFFLRLLIIFSFSSSFFRFSFICLPPSPFPPPGPEVTDPPISSTTTESPPAPITLETNTIVAVNGLPVEEVGVASFAWGKIHLQ